MTKLSKRRCFAWFMLFIMILSMNGIQTMASEISAKDYRSIFVNVTGNGDVLINDEVCSDSLTVEPGTEVKLQFVPQDGCTIKEALAESSTETLLETTDSNAYTIVMPEDDVTITATFQEGISVQDIESEDSGDATTEENTETASTTEENTTEMNAETRNVDFSESDAVYNGTGKGLGDTLNVSSEKILSELSAHTNDTKYLGVSYEDTTDIDFVSKVLMAAGAKDTPTDYAAYAKKNKIQYKTFTDSNFHNLVKTVLTDAFVAPGDIMVIGNSDNITQTGIFVGDSIESVDNENWSAEYQPEDWVKDPERYQYSNRWWTSYAYNDTNLEKSGNICTSLYVAEADKYKVTVIKTSKTTDYTTEGGFVIDDGTFDIQQDMNKSFTQTITSVGNGTLYIYDLYNNLLSTVKGGESVTFDFHEDSTAPEEVWVKAVADEGHYVIEDNVDGMHIEDCINQTEYERGYYLSTSYEDNEYSIVFSDKEKKNSDNDKIELMAEYDWEAFLKANYADEDDNSKIDSSLLPDKGDAVFTGVNAVIVDNPATYTTNRFTSAAAKITSYSNSKLKAFREAFSSSDTLEALALTKCVSGHTKGNPVNSKTGKVNMYYQGTKKSGSITYYKFSYEFLPDDNNLQKLTGSIKLGVTKESVKVRKITKSDIGFCSGLDVNGKPIGAVSTLDTDWTYGVSEYNLTGIDFDVYKDNGNDDYEDDDIAVTLTIDSDGTSDYEVLGAGEYYIKENADTVPVGYKALDLRIPFEIEEPSDGMGEVITPIDGYVYSWQIKSNKRTCTIENQPLLGDLKIAKRDSTATGLIPTPTYSLEGAIFQVCYYPTSVETGMITTEPRYTWYLETDENGNAEMAMDDLVQFNGDGLLQIPYTAYTDWAGNKQYSTGLPLGYYVIREVKAPMGYSLNDTIYPYTIDARNVNTSGVIRPGFGTLTADVTVNNTPLRGHVKVAKQLTTEGAKAGATLRNAKFTIVNISGKTINVNGQQIASYPGDVNSIKQNSDEYDALRMEILTKYPSCIVDTISTKCVRTEQRDENGNITVPELWMAESGDILPVDLEGAAGDYQYLIFESAASEGTERNQEWVQTWMPSASNPHAEYLDEQSLVRQELNYGGLQIIKVDSTTGDSKPQGDATFEGIKFDIINKNGSAVDLPNDDSDKQYQPGEVVTTLELEYDDILDCWIAETGPKDLPEGIYAVKEVAAGDGGYLLTDGSEMLVHVDGYDDDTGLEGLEKYYWTDTDGDGVSEKLEFKKENTPVLGGVKFGKGDYDRVKNQPQGDASLAGAIFTIKNMSVNDVWYNGQYYKHGDVIMEVVTDEEGVAKTDEKVLPMGSYLIEEKEPPVGYLKNEDFSLTFSIKEDGDYLDFTTDNAPVCLEKPIRGGVEVWKYDYDTKTSTANGGQDATDEHDNATLNGVLFEITLGAETKESILLNGVEYQPGDVIKTIETFYDADLKKFVARSGEYDFPVGTYYIREIKSSVGYKMSDGTPRRFVIEDDDAAHGKIIHPEAPANFEAPADNTAVEDYGAIFYNEVTRADMELVKLRMSTQDRMSVPFLVTNAATGESHVIVTDRNGFWSSSSEWNKHSYNTNANDHFVINNPDYTEDTVLKMEDFDYDAGIWFGLCGDGTNIPVDDDNGSMQYGRYVFKELRSNTNEGCKLVTFEAFAYKDGWTHNLDTIINTEDGPSISTLAMDKTTQSQNGVPVENATIIDSVYISGLTTGQDYTLKGSITYKDDEGEVVKSNGKKVTATKEFTATDTSMVVEMEFNLDARELAGKSVVVFEELLQGGTVVSKHTDVNDPNQTITYTDLHTTAVDGETGTHYGNSSTETHTIIDTVEYTDLIPNKEYTISGILMDKETNAPFLDKDGKQVTASKTFTPKTSDGYVELEFTFTANVVRKSIVAFEYLYDDKGINVGVHADITDEDQTVTYPEIHTTAVDAVTRSHFGFEATGTHTIIDTVAYYGLDTSKEYRIEGILMDKGTGEPFLDKNGEKVIVSKRFKPSLTDGTVEVSFTFTADMTNKTVVVFEYLYCDGMEVATHTDITDKGQTVSYDNELKTYAFDQSTGEHVGKNSLKKHKITDKVYYWGLSTDEEYTVKGVLMDKDTGKEFLDHKGKTVTAEKTFKPKTTDGFVELDFVFTADLSAKTIVVFEHLYNKDVEIATHTDINDEDQSIYYPEIGTSAVDGVTNNKIGNSGMTTIVDTVKYENLIPGKEYTIRGELMYKESKKPIEIDGERVTAEVTFTPKKPNGSVDITFVFDSSKLKTKTVVVFEHLYYEDVEIATHADINDDEQTVTYPETPPTEIIQTGDIVLWVGLGILALIAILSGVTLYRRKKQLL